MQQPLYQEGREWLSFNRPRLRKSASHPTAMWMPLPSVPREAMSRKVEYADEAHQHDTEDSGIFMYNWSNELQPRSDVLYGHNRRMEVYICRTR